MIDLLIIAIGVGVATSSVIALFILAAHALFPEPIVDRHEQGDDL